MSEASEVHVKENTVKEIIDHIDQKVRHEMESHAFIQWLSSSEIPLQKRLTAWLPGLALFGCNLKDITATQLVYPADEANTDPLKALVNSYCQEGGFHWKWLVHDLQALEMNPSTNTVSLMSSFWGPDHESTRRSAIQLLLLSNRASHPVQKLLVILTMGKAGHILFKKTCELGAQYEDDTGKTLMYLGRNHFDPYAEVPEPKLCCTGQRNLSQEVMETRMEPALYEETLLIVNQVFASIQARWTGFIELSKLISK